MPVEKFSLPSISSRSFAVVTSVESRHVELVGLDAEAAGVGDFHKIFAVPKCHAAFLRQTHALMIVPPIHFDLLVLTGCDQSYSTHCVPVCGQLP